MGHWHRDLPIKLEGEFGGGGGTQECRANNSPLSRK